MKETITNKKEYQALSLTVVRLEKEDVLTVSPWGFGDGFYNGWDELQDPFKK